MMHGQTKIKFIVGKSRILNMAKICNFDVTTKKCNACEIFTKEYFITGKKIK